MSAQGIMSCEKASTNPGLYPVEGQKLSFDTQTRSRNKFLSLSLGVPKNSPSCPILVVQPMSDSSSYALCRDSQGQLRSHKPANGAVLVSSSAISLPRTPACPGTQNSPIACQAEMSFSSFWYCRTNGDVVLMA